MLIVVFPLIVCIIGLLIWLMATKPEAKKIGEYMFVVGLFVTVFAGAGQVVKLF